MSIYLSHQEDLSTEYSHRALPLQQRIKQLTRKMQIQQRLKKMKDEFSPPNAAAAGKRKGKRAVATESTPNNVMDVIDDIYLEEESEVWKHLDDIEEDIKGWCDRKEEPPNFMLSILDRINSYKQAQSRKA